MSLIFFSSVSINICATSSSSFSFTKNNWFLWIECIVKTFYVITKSAGGVFLIPFGVAFVRVWLTCWQLWCEGFKIYIYYKWNPHWSIVILRRYFRSLFWSSIFIASCDLQYSWWDANDFSELKVLRHLKHTCLTWPCFDVCKDNSFLISLINSNVVLYLLKLIKD